MCGKCFLFFFFCCKGFFLDTFQPFCCFSCTPSACLNLTPLSRSTFEEGESCFSFCPSFKCIIPYVTSTLVAIKSYGFYHLSSLVVDTFNFILKESSIFFLPLSLFFFLPFYGIPFTTTTFFFRFFLARFLRFHPVFNLFSPFTSRKKMLLQSRWMNEIR